MLAFAGLTLCPCPGHTAGASPATLFLLMSPGMSRLLPLCLRWLPVCAASPSPALFFALFELGHFTVTRAQNVSPVGWGLVLCLQCSRVPVCATGKVLEQTLVDGERRKLSGGCTALAQARAGRPPSRAPRSYVLCLLAPAPLQSPRRGCCHLCSVLAASSGQRASPSCSPACL